MKTYTFVLTFIVLLAGALGAQSQHSLHRASQRNQCGKDLVRGE